MEKLESQLNDTEKALKTLDNILNTPLSIIVRDACIQRFPLRFPGSSLRLICMKWKELSVTPQRPVSEKRKRKMEE